MLTKLATQEEREEVLFPNGKLSGSREGPPNEKLKAKVAFSPQRT